MIGHGLSVIEPGRSPVRLWAGGFYIKRRFMNLDEIRTKLKTYKKENIEFGKSLDILLSRIKESKANVEEEILNCNNLYFVEKQVRDREVRYSLFFIYNSKKGREYIITFRLDKIRIITIFPLGRKTLRKYRKKGLNIKNIK